MCSVFQLGTARLTPTWCMTSSARAVNGIFSLSMKDDTSLKKHFLARISDITKQPQQVVINTSNMYAFMHACSIEITSGRKRERERERGRERARERGGDGERVS